MKRKKYWPKRAAARKRDNNMNLNGHHIQPPRQQGKTVAGLWHAVHFAILNGGIPKRTALLVIDGRLVEWRTDGLVRDAGPVASHGSPDRADAIAYALKTFKP